MNAPVWHPNAVATPSGWAHEKTGEQLTSDSTLTPAAGTEDYVPNSPAWMAEYAAANAPVAPANTVLPAITGTATVGNVLTASNGTWTGNPAPAFTYQWRRGATNIAGATNATYTLVAADVGAKITVRVTGTNDTGNAVATSAETANVAGIAPANTAAPAITGTPAVGAVLTVTNGTWTGTPTPTYARQWKMDGVDVAGQTATTYTVVAGDVGKVPSCTVTATNSAGNASLTATAAVVPA